MRKRATLFTVVLVMTIGAGLALAASAEKAIEGTLVDSRCYLADPLGKKGTDHGAIKRCGEACARAGWPVGLVTPKGKYYMLVVLPSQLASHVGQTLRATGTISDGSIIPSKLEVKKGETWEEIKFIKAMM